MGNDTVSIIVTTFYRNESLSKAIESVMDLKYDPIEVVVVDGSGEAHAEPVVDQFTDIKYVPLPEDRGEHGSRVAGFEHATGEYIQYLDDDDILIPGKLMKSLPKFTDDVGVVYSGKREQGRVVLPHSAFPEYPPRGEVLQTALIMGLVPCIPSTMVIDYDVLADVMPLSKLEGHRGAYGEGLKIELAKRTKFNYVDEALIERGVHDGNISTAGLDYPRGRRDIIRRYSDLYDDHPEIRQTLISKSYREEGDRILEQSLFSFRAIFCYLMSNYYCEEFDKMKFAKLVASIFGRPGKKLVLAIAQTDRFSLGGLLRNLRALR